MGRLEDCLEGVAVDVGQMLAVCSIIGDVACAFDAKAQVRLGHLHGPPLRTHKKGRRGG